MDSRTIERDVESQLARELPAVDLREVQVVAETLRVVIDHADGVTHELCVDATRALERAGFRDRFAIEVSSPGPEPPLRTLDHFRHAVGRPVAIRLQDESARGRSVSGTLTSVEPDRVELTTADGRAWIPTGTIRRARVLQRSE